MNFVGWSFPNSSWTPAKMFEFNPYLSVCYVLSEISCCRRRGSFLLFGRSGWCWKAEHYIRTGRWCGLEVSCQLAPCNNHLWNSDFGYNYPGSPIPTPFIDDLAARGVQLKQYYSHAVCTPARASLMTGRYHVNTGLTYVLTPGTPAGMLS